MEAESSGGAKGAGGREKRHRIGEDGEIRAALPSLGSSAERPGTFPICGASPSLFRGSVHSGGAWSPDAPATPSGQPMEAEKEGSKKAKKSVAGVCVCVWVEEEEEESSRNSPALPAFP